MENIQSYIESGILELYVLGDLSPAERAEVEMMCTKHPEIKAELLEIENTMSNIADEFSIQPSERVKENFFNSISFANDVEDDAKVRQLNTNDGVADHIVSIAKSKLNFYKLSLAACIALLLVSLFAIINLNKNLNDSRLQIASLQSDNQKFANQVNYLDQKVSDSETAIAVYNNPDFKLVNLSGTPFSPESKLAIRFNPKEQKVLLDLKSVKMPKNDEEHQYQLWALVDGKPVDLGVFDADGNAIGMKDMKAIGKAQAFAVTLEPKGGSINPTLDKMMVMGAI